MTLSFSQKWEDGKPTKFVDRIWDGLILNNIHSMDTLKEFQILHRKKLKKEWHHAENPFMERPKIHTIRKDNKDRWKTGNKIHFVINNRTKNRFQFAPILKVKSIQEVIIEWSKPTFLKPQTCKIYIDNLIFGIISRNQDTGEIWSTSFRKDFEVNDFIRNDGFENLNDFLNWFSEDFEGKIIHWTDTIY